MTKLKLWPFDATGTDGRQYRPWILATDEEAAQLQRVGILSAEIGPVVGLVPADDAGIAMMQRELQGMVVQ